MSPTDTALRALAAVLAPFVADELRASVVTVAPAASVFGSRAPYAAPPGRSKTEAGARRWLREHGAELRAFGATRSGGRAGRGVVWTIPAEGLARYDADERAKVESVEPVTTSTATTPTNEQIDAWIGRAGFRATRAPGGRGTR